MTDQNAEPTTEDLSSAPDWWKEKFTKATNEATDYRSKLEQVEAEIAASEQNGKSRAELIAAERKKTDETIQPLMREVVARKYGIPEGHSHRLIGKTREELEQDALALADLFN